MYSLQYSESYAGDVFMMSIDEPYYALECALNKIFVTPAINCPFALLTIGCNTVAMLKTSHESFRIFDSHARDLFGVQHPFGKCIWITVSNIQNLAVYF